MSGGENKLLIVAAVALVALSAIILTGIAVVGQFGYFLRTPITIAENGIVGVAESATLVGSTGDYPFLQSLTGCSNITNATNVSVSGVDYTIDAGDVNGGTITITAAGVSNGWNGTTMNCTSLNYLATSNGTETSTTFVAGLTIFATFSVVIALAIVGMVILNIFKTKKKE